MQKKTLRKANSIDVVLGTRILCCSTQEEITSVLSEIKRVLRPGGRYIFVEPTAAPTISPSRVMQLVLSPLLTLLDGSSYQKQIAQVVVDENQ